MSCRGGVEEAAETRLNDLAVFRGLYTPGSWKCDKSSASLSFGPQSREPMGELKSWQEHQKVLLKFIRQIAVLICLAIS